MHSKHEEIGFAQLVLRHRLEIGDESRHISRIAQLRDLAPVRLEACRRGALQLWSESQVSGLSRLDDGLEKRPRRLVTDRSSQNSFVLRVDKHECRITGAPKP